MINPIDMFADGGLIMWVIAFGAFVHLVLCAAQLGVARLADLRPVLWGGFVFLLMLGVLGGFLGLIQTFQAVAMAAPETKDALVAQGMGVSAYPMTFALMCALPNLLAVGVAASVRATLAPTPTVGEAQ